MRESLKQYVSPQVDVVEFSNDDIILTSYTEYGNDNLTTDTSGTGEFV